MSQENVEIVRLVNEAFNRSDATGAFRFVDPEVRAETRGTPGAEGEFSGHAGLLAMLGAFWQVFDDPHSEIEDCTPAGDHAVLVGVRVFGRGKTSGITTDMYLGQVVTLRDGKVVRWRVFPTKAEALEAAGLAE